MSREVMRQALEALESNQANWPEKTAAITALRAALAEPEQEPVAWRFYDGKMWCYVDHLTDLPETKFQPLYTHPPQRTEPEQEPVAWMNDGGDLLRNHPEQYGRENENWKPLYTHPPQRTEFTCSTGLCRYRKPLTNEQIKEIYVSKHWYEMGEFTWGAAAVVARAIEKKHGIE